MQKSNSKKDSNQKSNSKSMKLEKFPAKNQIQKNSKLNQIKFNIN